MNYVESKIGRAFGGVFSGFWGKGSTKIPTVYIQSLQTINDCLKKTSWVEVAQSPCVAKQAAKEVAEQEQPEEKGQHVGRILQAAGWEVGSFTCTIHLDSLLGKFVRLLM